MGKRHTWTDEDLAAAVAECFSYAAVIKKLGLVPAGGNYMQVQARIRTLELSTAHFTGMGWRKGMHASVTPVRPIEELLVANGHTQSNTLKKRLFRAGLKTARCEICGWAKQSEDGRIPVELDHINGDRFDNRLENLRILCPNCHSLQLTHRGRNKGIRYAEVRVIPIEQY